VAESSKKSEPAQAARRVLVVEDSATMAATVRLYLESSGLFEVGVAGSVTEARTHISRFGEPECILLDLTLPDAEQLTGLKIFRGLVPKVAIVVLTGRDEEELAIGALRAGAQDFLNKGSVNASEIVRAVRYSIERKKSDAVIIHQAFHDSLTDLPGRAYALNAINTALDLSARPPGSKVPLMYFDLDGFKQVNDEYGHHAGDVVLQVTAKRVSAVVRPADVVARMGGDEFLFLSAQDLPESVLAEVAQRIISAICTPTMIDGSEIQVGASIGITVSEEGEDAQSLIDRADRVMYLAKKVGGNRYVFDTSGQVESPVGIEAPIRIEASNQ